MGKWENKGDVGSILIGTVDLFDEDGGREEENCHRVTNDFESKSNQVNSTHLPVKHWILKHWILNENIQRLESWVVDLIHFDNWRTLHGTIITLELDCSCYFGPINCLHLHILYLG